MGRAWHVHLGPSAVPVLLLGLPPSVSRVPFTQLCTVVS